METVTINVAMAAIGYSASPDNEESLRDYIAGAKRAGALPADFDPFITPGTDPPHDAYETGGASVVRASDVPTLVTVFGDGHDVKGTILDHRAAARVTPATPAAR